MHCSEAVFWPYEAMHAKSSRMFVDKVPGRPFPLTIGRNYYNESRLYFNLMGFIDQYSQKDLSYETDRLQAFLGILASFAERKEPIYQVWGVPVVKRTGHWSIMLIWASKKAGKRRHHFPSWSWAGWTGLPEHGFLFHMSSVRVAAALLNEVSQGTDSNPDIIPIDKFVEMHAENRNCALDPSRYLYLYVEMTTVPFMLIRWSEEDKRSARAGLRKGDLGPDLFRDGFYAKTRGQGCHNLSYFQADDRDLDLSALHGKSLRAFRSETAPFFTCLIVVVKREGVFERVGTFQHCSGPGVASNRAYELPDGSLAKIAPDTNCRLSPRQDALYQDWRENFKKEHILLG